MTYEAEQYLLHEMEKEDFLDIQDIGHFNEVLDSTIGIDEHGSLEDDELLFPQPIFKGE